MLHFRFAPWTVAPFALLIGCLTDNGDCKAHQELNAIGNCACVSGYVLDVHLRCVACGKHEVSKGDVCECAEGYVRGADDSCGLASADVGTKCSDDSDCKPGAPHCEPGAAGDAGADGYCTTTGCESSTECQNKYGCDTAQTPSVCIQDTTGQNDLCTTVDDCAGKEASFCQTFAMPNVCLVPNCDFDAQTGCFPGWECCNLAVAIGQPTFCVPQGTCKAP